MKNRVILEYSFLEKDLLKDTQIIKHQFSPKCSHHHIPCLTSMSPEIMMSSADEEVTLSTGAVRSLFPSSM